MATGYDAAEFDEQQTIKNDLCRTLLENTEGALRMILGDILDEVLEDQLGCNEKLFAALIASPNFECPVCFGRKTVESFEVNTPDEIHGSRWQDCPVCNGGEF